MPTVSELRARLNISQEELARRANVSYRTISRLENGERIRRNVANSIAQALGVQLNEISGITLSSAVHREKEA